MEWRRGIHVGRTGKQNVYMARDSKPEFVRGCVHVVVQEGVGLGSCMEVGVSDAGMECKFDTVQGHRGCTNPVFFPGAQELI